MNRLEHAARVLRALASMDARQQRATVALEQRFDARRAELLAAAPQDVRELVLTERQRARAT